MDWYPVLETDNYLLSTAKTYRMDANQMHAATSYCLLQHCIFAYASNITYLYDEYSIIVVAL